MAIRIASRLILLVAGLALAAALLVGAVSFLATTAQAQDIPVVQPEPSGVKLHNSTDAAEDAAKADERSPSPVVVLVLAGIVLLAVLPPMHRTVHVYHRSYRSDWI